MNPKYSEGALAAPTPADGKLLVGHVDETGRDDPRVPIVAREYRAPAAFADARCRHCTTRSELGTCGGVDVLTLFVHRDGCPELAAVRALVTP